MTSPPRLFFILIAAAAFAVVVVESDDGGERNVKEELVVSAGQKKSAEEDGGGSYSSSTTRALIKYARDADFNLWATAHSKRYATPQHRASAERTWLANKAWAFAANAANAERVEKIAVKRVDCATLIGVFVYATQRVHLTPIVSSVNTAPKDSAPTGVNSMILKRALETKKGYPEHATPLPESVRDRWCAVMRTMHAH